jgi:hypothetical protein
MLKGFMAWPLMGLSVAPCAMAQTTVQWVAPGGGSWNAPTNWSPATVPSTTSHNAVIGGTTAFTIVRDALSTPLNNLNIVNADATLHALNGGLVQVVGTQLVNNGTIVIDGSSGKLISLRGGAATVLSGTGLVKLEAPSETSLAFASISNSSQSQRFTFGSGQRITGTGTISARFHNEGVIHADIPGRSIAIANNDASNANLIMATDGGIVNITAGVEQQFPGRLLADGGVIRLNGGLFTGGSVESINGGEVRIEGVSQLDGISFSGDALIPNGAVPRVGGGGIVNNGRIVIGSAPFLTEASLNFFNVETTIDGDGMIILRSAPSTPAARLNSSGVNNTFTTNGTAHTIGGTGLLQGKFRNAGRIAPGEDTGSIGAITVPFSSTLQQLPTGVLELELAGTQPGEHDMLITSGSNTASQYILGGTLRVVAVNGYVPGPGNEFELIKGRISGEFEHLDLPEGVNWKVEYNTSGVWLYAVCSADFDGTGFVDIDDFTGFVAAFEAGEDTADFDGTGFVDIDDFVAFVNAFESGC